MDKLERPYVLSIDDFSVHIYVVGGEKGEGEGILILFLNGSEVMHTITIDCCKAVYKTLKETNTAELNRCRWIKIPHHGSKTAKNAVQFFNHNVDSAVTTSFLSCNLPCDEVLRQYKNTTSKIYVTQKDKNAKSDFGMVRYEYSFKNSSVQLKITRFGNAYKYI